MGQAKGLEVGTRENEIEKLFWPGYFIEKIYTWPNKLERVANK